MWKYHINDKRKEKQNEYHKKIAVILAACLLLVSAFPIGIFAQQTAYPTPEGYDDHDYQKLLAFGARPENDDLGWKDTRLPEYWSGVGWTDTIPKKVKSIVLRTILPYGVVPRGEMDVSNFTALKMLICDDSALTKLDISGCLALTTLRCANSDLPELDVSDNTALIELGVTNNRLKELDISSNTSLKLLYCFYNPELSTLDISSNTALTVLSCSFTALKELDVSKNTALTNLDCDSNSLSELDVSRNTALTRLSCSNNSLSKLDVSRNTALTRLSCSNNSLSKLDVSKNTALTMLRCHNNQLEQLDVSQNTALTELICNDNQLLRLELSNQANYQEVVCDNNALTELDLSSCTKIASLTCLNNYLDITIESDFPDQLYALRQAGVLGGVSFVPQKTRLATIQLLDPATEQPITAVGVKEQFLIQVTTPGTSPALKVYNESGTQMGTRVVRSESKEDGSVTTVLTMSLAQPKKDVFSVFLTGKKPLQNSSSTFSMSLPMIWKSATSTRLKAL